MQNRLGIFLIVAVLSGTVLGGWLGQPLGASPPEENETDQVLKIFTSVLASVQENFVEEVATDELVESSIRGLLRTLDPHSSFFSVSDYNRLQEEQRGRYYGLGITIRSEAPGSGRVVVVEPPSPGTPAYRVGLRAGDVISRIEGQPIDDWDLNKEVIPNLKGPKGTSVNITIERPGDPEPIDLAVIRDEISLFTIKYVFHISSGIGYIRINKFSETTGKELNEALEKLGEDQLKGLVLDLRDNPGGALSQALAVSDSFLNKGQLIVSTRSRKGKEREFHASRGTGYDYPMVVLINRNSASASEIVSGALQDHDRALIVGETSFGKALVQTIFPLEGNGGLALTTGRYYTPSNRLIQRDYSGSFYEYYYSRRESTPEEATKYYTDSSRVVFGGGGITPDRIVQLERNSDLFRMIERKRLFLEFVGGLVEGRFQSDVKYDYDATELEELSPTERENLIGNLSISEATLRVFQDFLREKEIKFSDQDYDENRVLIANRLKQGLFLNLFGDELNTQVALEIDRQVQQALQLLPEAAALLENRMARQ